MRTDTVQGEKFTRDIEQRDHAIAGHGLQARTRRTVGNGGNTRPLKFHRLDTWKRRYVLL
jgi:hypothetical protein